MRSKPPKTLPLLAVALLLAPGTADAATYYVGSAGCSDSGSGSDATPYCTIAVGIAQLQAGDTLLIKGGSYAEQIDVDRSGTAGQPITIAAADLADRPVISTQSPAKPQEGLITVIQQEYVHLRGLTVRDAPGFGITINASSHVVLERLRVETSEQGGIIVAHPVWAGQATDVQVLSCHVEHSNNAGLLAQHETLTISNVADFTVAHNTIVDCGEEGIDVKDNSAGGSVHDNVVDNTGAVGIYLANVSDIVVHDNRVSRSGGSGLQLTVGDCEGETVAANNRFYRNTVHSCTYNGFEFWTAEPGTISGTAIYNNVFYHNTQLGVRVNNAAGADIHDLTVKNNILDGNGQGGIHLASVQSHDTSHNLYHEASQGIVGSDNVFASPGYLSPGDPASSNFALGEGSQAIDAGTTSGLPTLTWPLHGAPDIGAFEFDSDLPPPDGGGVDGPPAGDDLGPSSDGPRPDGWKPPDGGPPSDGPPGGDSVHHGITLEGGCGCDSGRDAGRAPWPTLVLLASIGLLALVRRDGADY